MPGRGQKMEFIPWGEGKGGGRKIRQRTGQKTSRPSRRGMLVGETSQIVPSQEGGKSDETKSPKETEVNGRGIREEEKNEKPEWPKGAEDGRAYCLAYHAKRGCWSNEETCG